MAARSPKDSTTDIARAAIKDFILAEHLQPGDALPTEIELADRISVSRSSIREAIRTLSALDVVDVRHGIGTFVGGLTFKPLVEGLAFRAVLLPGDGRTSLREVLEVRLGLDLATADALVSTMQGQEHPELRALVEEMRMRNARGDGFPEADRAFHTELLRLTGNSIYGQLVGAFWDVYTGVLSIVGVATTAEDMTDTAAAHGAMLDAAEAGDADAFRAAVHAHYEPLRRVIAKSVEQEA